MIDSENRNKPQNQISDHDWEKLSQYIASIHYGSITLTIQEGKIVMIEKSEKIKMK